MYISQRNVIWLGYVTMQIRTWYVNHYNGVAASRSFDVSFLFCVEVFENFRWHDLDARRVLTNYYCNALIILGRRDARSQVCPNSGCRIKRGAVCLVFFFCISRIIMRAGPRCKTSSRGITYRTVRNVSRGKLVSHSSLKNP